MDWAFCTDSTYSKMCIPFKDQNATHWQFSPSSFVNCQERVFNRCAPKSRKTTWKPTYGTKTKPQRNQSQMDDDSQLHHPKTLLPLLRPQTFWANVKVLVCEHIYIYIYICEWLMNEYKFLFVWNVSHCCWECVVAQTRKKTKLLKKKRLRHIYVYKKQIHSNRQNYTANPNRQSDLRYLKPSPYPMSHIQWQNRTNTMYIYPIYIHIGLKLVILKQSNGMRTGNVRSIAIFWGCWNHLFVAHSLIHSLSFCVCVSVPRMRLSDIIIYIHLKPRTT